MTSCAVAAPIVPTDDRPAERGSRNADEPAARDRDGDVWATDAAPATEVVSASPRSMATSAAAALPIRPSLPSRATTSPFDSCPSVSYRPRPAGPKRERPRARAAALHGANLCAASYLRGLEPSQASHPESTTLAPHHGVICCRESERPTDAFALGYIMSIIGVP
jgi:hypothetical protein